MRTPTTYRVAAHSFFGSNLPRATGQKFSLKPPPIVAISATVKFPWNDSVISRNAPLQTKRQTTMSKKSFFSRISESLSGPKEITSEELDREVEDAVASTMAKEVDLVDAASVVSRGWGEPGDIVFIMSLTPIFNAIGSSEGRLADSLREACGNIFREKGGADRGRCAIKNSNFIMHFVDQEAIGFQLAVTIINAVGTFILMDRFKTMDIDGLLTVVDAGDITNDNGSIDASKIDAAVKKGGVPTGMKQPGPDAPIWLKLFWKANTALKATFSENQSKKDDAGGQTMNEGDDWRVVSHQQKNIQEKKKRGSDRREEKKKINPANDRRTSWRPRRMEESMKI
jgi:hypothetical protein